MEVEGNALMTMEIVNYRINDIGELKKNYHRGVVSQLHYQVHLPEKLHSNYTVIFYYFNQKSMKIYKC